MHRHIETTEEVIYFHRCLWFLEMLKSLKVEPAEAKMSSCPASPTRWITISLGFSEKK
jgi:hypothetical protein